MPQYSQQQFDAFVDDARNGRLNAVEVALAEGVPVNATDKFGFTALFSATTTRQHDVVELLLRSPGVAVDARCFSETPLLRAAQAGSVDTLRALLTAGANPMAINALGRNALMAVVSDFGSSSNPSDNERASKAELLLAMSTVRVLAVDHAGNTAEQLARRNNRHDIADAIAATVSRRVKFFP